MKRIRCLIGFLLCAFILCNCIVDVQATGSERGRILVIDSYSYAEDSTKQQIAGIEKVIDGWHTVDYQFMNAKNIVDTEILGMFTEMLAYRLSSSEPYDVIVVCGDTALSFVLEHQEELFEGIPIIFSGVYSKALAERACKNPLVSGILVERGYAENIRLALTFNTTAKKVVGIFDNTTTGQIERENFYACQEQFPNMEFSEINASECYTYVLQRQFRDMTSDTIALFICMTEDASGKKYSSADIGPFIQKYSSVPVYRMEESRIGEGFLGGYVVSMEQCGQIAANMAGKIIAGDSIPADLIQSPTIVCLDEDVLREYEYSLSLIPHGATVVNHKEGYLERHEEAIVPLGMLMAFLMVLMGIVFYNNMKYRKLLNELGNAKNIVETASQHDFLTGLGNRSKFVADLRDLIEQEIPCSILMLDIDDFKVINDTYGHTVGDITLQVVANRMKELQSPILTPYRFAGDEFIIILQSTQSNLVEKISYACRNVFADEFAVSGEMHKITGSIGVARYPMDAQNPEELIICADKAMYQVKKSGKNQFANYKDIKANSEG